MNLGLFGLSLLVHLLTHCSAFPKEVNVLGLFEDRKLNTAFLKAIDRINENSSILRGTRLIPRVEFITNQNSFQTSKAVCEHLETGIAAIFGPSGGASSSYVRFLANEFEIPHFETHMVAEDKLPFMTINIYPDPNLLAKAFIDFIVEAQWKSFAILYDDDEGLIRLKRLLRGRFKISLNIMQISVRQLVPGENPQVILKELKKAGETHIVLDCKAEKILEIFQHASEVGMTTYYQHYLITSLDIQTLDMSAAFNNIHSNISAFAIANSSDVEVKDYFTYGNRRYGDAARESQVKLSAESRLLHDAVTMFAHGLQKFVKENFNRIRPLLCRGQGGGKSQFGRALVDYLRIKDQPWAANKTRTNFTLDYVKLRDKSFKKAGQWSTSSGLLLNETDSATLRQQLSKKLYGQTLRIVTKLAEPYCSERLPKGAYHGNERFEGFVIDLIQRIAEKQMFNYTLQIVSDGKHGNLQDGKWNGLIKELIEQQADVAIGDLTINSERESVVDFTMPFMNLGISILMRQKVVDPDIYSFHHPMEFDVWLYMLTGYLGVSLVLFILARLTPAEWSSEHPCETEPDELENQFSFSNCMWFTIGSLMQQGCDFLPKAVSTRLVAGIWWFFTLIMISSYTANLAAFLTLDRIPSSITNIEDLARQTKIKYGCMRGGTTVKFFNESKIDTLKGIALTMENNPSVYVTSNDEGVDRVLRDDYAYFIESSANEYYRNKNCNLMSVGPLLDSKSYGIATPEGSPYVFGLSEAILILQEQGDLLKLKNLWFKEKLNITCDSAVQKGSAGASELDLENVGGVFVVLLGGLGLSCVVGAVEFVWTARKMAKEERVSFSQLLNKELRFALKFKESKKPIKKKQEESEIDLSMGSLSGF